MSFPLVVAAESSHVDCDNEVSCLRLYEHIGVSTKC
jgi:hypothetical protein